MADVAANPHKPKRKYTQKDKAPKPTQKPKRTYTQKDKAAKPNPTYTQKNKNQKLNVRTSDITQQNNAIVAVRAPSPLRTTVSKKLAKQRADYKAMVQEGTCIIHQLLDNTHVKHRPYFKCTIRKVLHCNRCGHNGHMNFECQVMDLYMKEQAKGGALGVRGLAPTAQWHGDHNVYDVNYKLKLARFPSMNLPKEDIPAQAPLATTPPSKTSRPSANTRKQARGLKKAYVIGKWETYTKPELFIQLERNNVPFGKRGLYHRGTMIGDLVKLAYSQNIKHLDA